MDFDKHSSCSPGVYSAISPQPDIAGYVDMTVGSTPKSSRGLSPCSSNHSLGSSPASSITQFNQQPVTNSGAKVIKASGKPVQKSVNKSPGPAGVGFTENQLTVARLKLADKRSPSSSGKESEDESYVSFKPSQAVAIGNSPVEMHHRGSHDWAMGSQNQSKTQHGYSKSYDSAMMRSEAANFSVADQKVSNHRSSGKRDYRDNRDRDEDSFRRRTNSNKEKRLSSRQVSMANNYHFKPEVKPSEERVQSSTSSLLDRVSKGQSPVLDRRIDYIPDNDMFSDKYFEKGNDPKDIERNASGTDIGEGYLEYLPGEILPVNEVPPSKRRGSSLKEKLKINSVIKDTKEAVNKATKEHIKPEQARRQFPEREYCEIDFPEQTTVNISKSVSYDNVKGLDKKGAVTDAGSETSTKLRESEKKPESDYMESDPAPLTVSGLTQETSTSIKSKKKIESDDFSYMDFDPETDKKRPGANSDTNSKESKKDVTFKAPGRVQSFISQDLDPDESKDDEIFDSTDTKGIEFLSKSGTRKSSQNNDGVSVLERRNSSKDSPASPSRVSAKPELIKSISQQSMGGEESVGPSFDTVSDSLLGRKTSHSSIGSYRKGSQDSVNSLRLSSQSSQEGSVNSRKLSEENKGALLRKTSQGSQESLGSVRLCMLDKSQGKLVVKSTFPVAPEGKEVVDEGYCDINFEKVKEAKDNEVNKELDNSRKHHRSGSDSSNNSDRSRKIFEGIPTEPLIPTPESTRCYIDDNTWDGMPVPETPVSFISEESVQSEGAVGGKDIGSPLKQALGGRRSSPGVVRDAASEFLRNSGPSRGVSSSQASVQTGSGSGVSRQTSAPVGPPKCNRLSNELPAHSRNRNTSAPGGVGIQSSVTTADKTAALQGNLEPCQDLQKQKLPSMPCVTLPIMDKPLVASDLSKDSAHASRHSFTDLSQYEEMTFPSNLLQQDFQMRCSSQQQLHDSAANLMSDSSELQYADLDLMSSKENLDDKCSRMKSRHTSSNNDLVQGSVPYAQIDYQRTETLKQDKDKDVKFTI